MAADGRALGALSGHPLNNKRCLLMNYVDAFATVLDGINRPPHGTVRLYRLPVGVQLPVSRYGRAFGMTASKHSKHGAAEVLKI